MWRRFHPLIFAGVLMMTAAVGLSGCQSFKHALGFEEEPPPPPAPRYYDFPDVLVPDELSLQPGKSVVYEYGGMKVGLLVFSGRVEVASVVDFFRNSLPKDGWTLVNSVKFSRILLNFSKPDRTCQIFIKEKTLNTEVEIWVHPLRAVGS